MIVFFVLIGFPKSSQLRNRINCVYRETGIIFAMQTSQKMRNNYGVKESEIITKRFFIFI